MARWNFIKTADKHTAEQLKKSKLTLISESNGVYTFLNDPKKKFSKTDDLKFSYSNMVCI